MRASSSVWMSDPATAWAVFSPTAEDRWDRAKVAHLHRRAGFLASHAILERDLQEGPERAIERLIAGDSRSVDGLPASEFDASLSSMARSIGTAGLARAQGVWLYRLIHTPHPLRERLTLFWHNHFATSDAKVNNTGLMLDQNDLLREHASGKFGPLLHAVGKDPAMLIWLDATTNKKTHPNENYAREVMELFALGRGHYTEKDIQEAARTFTGWFVINGEFREIPGEHDNEPKTILGQTGNLDGDDLVDLLLKQPACAEFLCRKLAKHFITDLEEPPPALIAPLAEALRKSDYHLVVPIQMILRSRQFFHASTRWKRVKSPIELTVGLIRALEVFRPTVRLDALADATTRMGQALFAPPSVAGWEGGKAWINTSTSLMRTNFVLGLLAEQDAEFGGKLDPDRLAKSHGAKTPEQAARLFLDLLLPAPDGLDSQVRKQIENASSARDALTLVLTAPELQLN